MDPGPNFVPVMPPDWNRSPVRVLDAKLSVSKVPVPNVVLVTWRLPIFTVLIAPSTSCDVPTALLAILEDVTTFAGKSAVLNIPSGVWMCPTCDLTTRRFFDESSFEVSTIMSPLYIVPVVPVNPFVIASYPETLMYPDVPERPR
jgi:hypothetical protein